MNLDLTYVLCHLQQSLEVLGVQAVLPGGIERIVLRHKDGGEELAIGKRLVSDMPHLGGNIYGRQSFTGNKGIVADGGEARRKMQLRQIPAALEAQILKTRYAFMQDHLLKPIAVAEQRVSHHLDAPQACHLPQLDAKLKGAVPYDSQRGGEMHPCELVAFPKAFGSQLHNALRQNDGVESGLIEGEGLNPFQAGHVGKVKDAENSIIPSPLGGKVLQLG